MIVWDDSILTGIPNVDRDHREIARLINAFLAIIGSDSGTASVHDSFRAMEHCIYRHLDREERMLEAVGYDGNEGHFATHRRLLDDLQEIWDDMLLDADFRPDEAAQKWLRSWLFDHVRHEDFAYRDWIVAAGKEDLANARMEAET
jgi:hemerythrin-like metal-binding protein